MDPTDSPAPDASSFSDPSRFSPISVGDHAGYVYIAAILFAVYTTLSAIVRGHIKVNLFGYDDWTLFGSTVFHVAHVVAIGMSLQYGLGKTPELITGDTLGQAGASLFAANIMFVGAHCLSKCSVLCLVLRLFTREMKKLSLICAVALALTIAWGVGSIVALSVACDAKSLLTDLSEANCPSQPLRWRLVIGVDIATEIVLLVLPTCLIIPLQMSWGRRFQVMFAFWMRAPVIAFAFLRLHFFLKATGSSSPSFAATDAVVWTQFLLCWSLMSASIPNLKTFMKSFNSGFGLEIGAITTGYGYGSQNYEMNSMQSGNAQKSRDRDYTSDRSRSNSGADKLRTGKFQHSTDIYGKSNMGEDESSMTSDNSQEMIIRRDVQWTVSYDRAR